MRTHSCRYCHGRIHRIASFGSIPLVNYFPKRSEARSLKCYPLDLWYCDSCGLGQTGIRVPPKRIFPTYHYVTGTSSPLVSDLEDLAREIITRYLPPGGSVLDIGCNDGTLLSGFPKDKYVLHGVEPSVNVGKLAKKRGIEVTQDFFDLRLAKTMNARYGTFDVITLTHTLANMPDLRSVMAGIAFLLRPGGTVIIEVDSLESMVKQGNFDSIYHEHYYYFSKYALGKLASDAGLTVMEMRDLKAQGGSTRVYLTKQGKAQKARLVRKIDKKAVIQFGKGIREYRKRFWYIFGAWKGKSVYGFGAPAKAVTFLHVMGLNEGDIRGIVDSTEEKQGRVMPGTTIPVYQEGYLKGKPVDCVLILAWNYRQEILAKIGKLAPRATVILPFPRLEILRPR